MSIRMTGGPHGHWGGVTTPLRRTPAPVPVRTILATIGLLLVTALLLYILVETRQVITWIVVGAFFAVALYPVVGWVQRRLFGGRSAGAVGSATLSRRLRRHRRGRSREQPHPPDIRLPVLVDRHACGRRQTDPLAIETVFADQVGGRGM